MGFRKVNTPFVRVIASLLWESRRLCLRIGGVDSSVEELKEEGALALLFLLPCGLFLRLGTGLAGASLEDLAAFGFSVAFTHNADIVA
jgi:hypothetical protein